MLPLVLLHSLGAVFSPFGLRASQRPLSCACAMFAHEEELVCVYDTDSMEVAQKPIVFGAGSFASASELQEALVERGVDVSSWGRPMSRGATKTVSDLWEEIELGECDLRVDRLGLCRQLNVVKVRVQRPGQEEAHLIESTQIFSDGQVRSRRLPLSEKMFPGERWDEAAERGIVEELGSAMMEDTTLWPIELVADSLVAWDETRTSKSYPHLVSRYSLYQVDAVVHGLPSESFSTVEYVDNCSIRAKDDVVSRCAPRLTYGLETPTQMLPKRDDVDIGRMAAAYKMSKVEVAACAPKRSQLPNRPPPLSTFSQAEIGPHLGMGARN